MPLELFLHVSRLLDFPDLKTLGSLNSRFRAILAPRIFNTVRFTNLEADEDAISQVVSKHGSHITTLQFDFHLRQDVDQPSSQPLPDGRYYGPDDDGIEDDVLIGTRLSSISSQILSGEKLSQVTSLTIKFLPEENFEGEAWGDAQGLGCIYIYEDATHPAQLEQEEKKWPSWRRAMSSMWSGLSRNQNIKSLELVGLPAVPLSSWLQPEWPAFLGRLQTLVLGLAGGDNGAGWKANTTEGYRDFLESLDAHFFDHAKSLVRLHLIADAWNFYGDSDMWASVMALRPGQMPRLEDLRIENCFIDEKCCEFLYSATASSSDLKKLHLINCMANEATPSWADLFSRLYTQQNLSLEELIVTNERIEFPDDYESNIPHLPVTNRLASQSVAVRSSPTEDSGERRPFEYGTVDDKYGMIFSNEERNVSEYESGTDMHAYRKLMEHLSKYRK